MHVGHSIVAGDHVEMKIDNYDITIHIDHQSNPSLLFNAFVSREEQNKSTSLISSTYTFCDNKLNMSGKWGVDLDEAVDGDHFELEFSHYEKICCNCVDVDKNKNLCPTEGDFVMVL